MVADETELKRIHETERAVVECQPRDGHVVCVHHTVREADGLPPGDESRRARDDLSKKFLILVRRVG